MKSLGLGALAFFLVVGCLPPTQGSGFIFQYGIGAYDCDTTCATPNPSAPIDTAARGDTVWLQHAMSLIGAIDSFRVQLATLRPDCAVNVAVLSGNSTVRSLPTPTCADSTARVGFQLAGVDQPQTIVVYTRWVVDSGLAAGLYLLRGRVMVHPLIEPVLGFQVQ